MDKKFTFTFSIEEANLILTALGGMPYSQVAKMIENIQQQAKAQAEEKAE